MHARLMLFAAALIVLPPHPLSAQPTQDSLPRDARWRADLHALADTLVARHANAFAFVSREDFARAVSDLDAAIPGLSDLQVELRFARIGALLRDGHTNAPLPLSRLTVRWPVSTLWTDSGAFLVASTPDFDSLLGRRVVAVNGHPFAAVADTLRLYLSNENDYGLRARAGFLLWRPQALRALGLAADTAVTVLDLDGPPGRTRAALASVPVQNSGVRRPPAAPVPLSRTRTGEKYWWTWLADSRTLYVAYNQCRDFNAFRAMTDSLAPWLDSATRVVVDLRNNSGGNSSVINPLLAALAARPRLSQPGALFVPIGRGTFSSGMQAALSLKRLRQGTLVGEPIGERPNTYGEMRSFRLPHSNLEITYSTRFFRNVDGNADAVYPDVSIPPTAEEQIAGRDAVMEWILAQPGAG